MTLAKTSNDELRRLSLGSVSDLNQRLTALEGHSSSMQTTVDGMSTASTRVSDLSEKMDQMLGTGSTRLEPRAIRRAVRKIRQFETQLNQLTALLTTNECTSSPCRNGGTCIDSYNGYLCRCPPQWEGATCEQDVNECARYQGTDLGKVNYRNLNHN